MATKTAVVLLDDVLSALDVHTIEWVVNKCLSGSLLKGRTVILVTHNLAMTGKLAKRIVTLSSHGVATVNTSTEEAVAQEPSILRDQPEENKEMYDEIDESRPLQVPILIPAAGKLIAEEEVALGHVSLSASEPSPYSYTVHDINHH